MKPCESGNLVLYCDFFLSVPLYKVFVALIALGTSNREHTETLVPHHIKPRAAIFMHLIDYPCILHV